jgi:hypothetical protein
VAAAKKSGAKKKRQLRRRRRYSWRSPEAQAQRIWGDSFHDALVALIEGGIHTIHAARTAGEIADEAQRIYEKKGFEA